MRTINSRRLDRIVAAVRRDDPEADREAIRDALLAEVPWAFDQRFIDSADEETVGDRVFIRLYTGRELT